jgi:hypothetical protein
MAFAGAGRAALENRGFMVPDVQAHSGTEFARIGCGAGGVKVAGL